MLTIRGCGDLSCRCSILLGLKDVINWSKPFRFKNFFFWMNIDIIMLEPWYLRTATHFVLPRSWKHSKSALFGLLSHVLRVPKPCFFMQAWNARPFDLSIMYDVYLFYFWNTIYRRGWYIKDSTMLKVVTYSKPLMKLCLIRGKIIIIFQKWS